MYFIRNPIYFYNMSVILLEVIFALLLQTAPTYAAAKDPSVSKAPKVYPVHTFRLRNDSRFEYDGNEIVLAGATVHYFRIPRDHWEHRLKLLAESGLNTLFTAIDWSTHEVEETEYKFTGERDFVYFIRLAEQLGLKVILRPGPFIGEQRDLGGYPSWLLWQQGEPEISLDSESFRYSLASYFRELLPRIKPLLADHGGPVIMLEITKEAADSEWLMRIFRKRLGKHIMYSIFKEDRNKRSVQAVVSTEDGWRLAPLELFRNSWPANSGCEHDDPKQRYRDMLQTLLSNTSIGIGAFHAGTDFGFKAGAFLEDGQLVTYSTDNVDALVAEDGTVGESYPMLQTIVCSYFGREMTRPLPQPSTIALGALTLTPIGSVLDRTVLERVYKWKTTQETPGTFEEMRQTDGFILYETNIKYNYSAADLHLHGVRDRAQVYLHSKLKGFVVRGFNEVTSVHLGNTSEGDLLQIFVENLGRPYWGTESPRLSRKGLTVSSPVTINGDVVTSWTLYGLPFDHSLSLLQIVSEEMRALMGGDPWEQLPFIAGSAFVILKSPEEMADTFLDMRGWGRGIVLLNGHNLGRYWPEAGSRKGLLVPKSYLRVNGEYNYLAVLELDEVPSRKRVVFRHNLTRYRWVPMCNVAVGLVVMLLGLSAVLFLGRDAKGWRNKLSAGKTAQGEPSTVET